MSLARALTKRMRSHEEVPAANMDMNRAYSTRRSDKPIDRAKISLPLELISSSNALAYEAPDIQHMQAIQQQSQQQQQQVVVPHSATSSASSTKSYEDSMSSPGLSSASSVTSNEMSREGSPITDKHKHHTTFFHFEEESKPAPVQESPVIVTPEQETPNVPQRALSHTKHTHQALARQRSQRRSSPPPARTPPATRSSVDMFSIKPDADHPFGAELEKVNELAEEFGMKDVQRSIQILDDESQYLIDNGFHRFSAEDYINEIQPLFASAFPAPVAWL